MKSLVTIYSTIFIDRPRVALLGIFLFVGFFALFAPDFRLDASADSLLLEKDSDLRYYRAVTARYGADSFLMVTYKPHDDLFSAGSLGDLRRLRDSLLAVSGQLSQRMYGKGVKPNLPPNFSARHVWKPSKKSHGSTKILLIQEKALQPTQISEQFELLLPQIFFLNQNL